MNDVCVGVQKPSLDKQQGIVTVIGTGAATPKKLEELLQKTIKKKYVRILPTPKKETSEAEKGGKESNHPPPPPQQQQHPDANNMGGTSGNMQHVGESSRMGQMGQYPMGHPGAPHGQMDQTRAQYGQMEQRYQYSMDGNQESSFRTKKHQESSWNVFNDENANSCTIM